MKQAFNSNASRQHGPWLIARRSKQAVQQQPLLKRTIDWRKPTLDQWAVIFCLVIIAAAITGAVPHADGALHKTMLVLLDGAAWCYVIASLMMGGGK